MIDRFVPYLNVYALFNIDKSGEYFNLDDYFYHLKTGFGDLILEQTGYIILK